MAQRDFSRRAILGSDGEKKYTYSISCSKCGKKDSTLAFNGAVGKDLPHEKIAKMFRDKGWTVHLAKAGMDTCGECRTGMMVTMNGNGADVPREMNVDAKRRINSKLHEAYDIDRSLYGAGWTDNRVAEELKMPKDWVRKVREELYGPEASVDVEKLKADMALFSKEFESLREYGESLKAEFSKILKSVGG